MYFLDVTERNKVLRKEREVTKKEDNKNIGSESFKTHCQLWMFKIVTDATMHMNDGERSDAVNRKYQSGDAGKNDPVQRKLGSKFMCF